MGILEKLEDLKLLLLPASVIISMIVGISIGKIYGISNFELTPPIDAINSIFSGTYTFDLPSMLALGVVVGLFFMMYPAMTNIKIGDVSSAIKSPRQIGVVLLFKVNVS